MSSRSALRVALSKRMFDGLLATRGANALERSRNTRVANQAGNPAMNVPLFRSANGVPLDAQFPAPFGDAATLFRRAAQFERARPCAGRSPGICAAARV